MGRKETSGRLSVEYHGLEVKVPSLFRCPISLDVMRSPVSLCTGITYDRASIQRWFDSGNNTCPATMQTLPSTDLVPNLTLGRLIALWASTAASGASSLAPSPVGPTPAAAAADLLRRIADPSKDPCPALHKLAAFFSDDDVDEFDKNAVVKASGAAETLVAVLQRSSTSQSDDDAGRGAAAVVRILAAMAASDCGIEEENRKRVAAALAADAASSVASLARVLRSRAPESRVDAARLVESMLRDADAMAMPGVKAAVAESEEMVSGLIRLVGLVDGKGRSLDSQAVEAGLSCLDAIAGSTRLPRSEMVRLGAVQAAVRVLSAADDAACTTGLALRVLEATVSCAEGRAVVCEKAETAIPAVLSKMTRGGTMRSAEAAVAVLWAVCHKYRDRRAVEAAAASKSGLTRLLLLMQSGCSPAAEQMASDLLKMFKVNAKTCIAGFDSASIHVMPY